MEKKIGKIITLEGADRTGKHTQAVLLQQRLQQEGYVAELLDFPQYNTLSGELVREYLAGEYGSKKVLGAKLPSVLYALNRFEEKQKLLQWKGEGKVVVLDRYAEANMAYQSAKLPLQKQAQFLQWLELLEYNIFGLPKSDIVVYLHVPIHIATLLAAKEAKETGKKKDVHEKDITFQKKVVKQYLALGKDRNWNVIECIENRTLLSKERIAEMVWETVRHSL